MRKALPHTFNRDATTTSCSMQTTRQTQRRHVLGAPCPCRRHHHLVLDQHTDAHSLQPPWW
jgi:hypothetical protein